MACSLPFALFNRVDGSPKAQSPDSAGTPTYFVKNTFVDAFDDDAIFGLVRKCKSDGIMLSRHEEKLQSCASRPEANQEILAPSVAEQSEVGAEQAKAGWETDTDEDDDSDESWVDSGIVHNCRDMGPHFAANISSELSRPVAPPGCLAPPTVQGARRGSLPAGSSSSLSAFVAAAQTPQHAAHLFRSPPPPPSMPPSWPCGRSSAREPAAGWPAGAALPDACSPPFLASAVDARASAAPQPADWMFPVASEPVSRSRAGGLSGMPSPPLGTVARQTVSQPCSRRPSLEDRGWNVQEHMRLTRAVLAGAADSYVLAVHRATRVPMNELLRLEVSGLLRKIPTGEDDQLTSVGSVYHADGACSPCVFWFRGACSKGLLCTYCHFVHPGQKNKRIRPSKSTREKLKA